MTYFSNMNKITFKNYELTDIMKRVVISDVVKDATVYLQDYIVMNGKTPENISYELYDTPFYHWTIIMINQILNPVKDWPLNNIAFSQYMESTYGVGNEGLVHHYETNETSPLGAGIIVDPTKHNPTEITSVSNYEYEELKNEAKSRIKVIRPSYITQITKKIKEALANG